MSKEKLTAAQAGIMADSKWLDPVDGERLTVVGVNETDVNMDPLTTRWKDGRKYADDVVPFLKYFVPVDSEAHVRAVRAEVIRECVTWLHEHDVPKLTIRQLTEEVKP